MALSSFYGGRTGTSITLVKRFDGVDIPQYQGNYVYKRKLYATLTKDNIEYYVYPWLEKTGSNYQNYGWKLMYFDGGNKNIINKDTWATSTITVDRQLAEGMRQCFEQGGATTNIVNYGDFVIIDTISGLNEYSNPDNGKIFKRGMNYDYSPSSNPYAGGELMGQLVGPKGDAPTIGMDTVGQIINNGGTAKDYTIGNGSLVPGKSGSTYNDNITYAYATFADVAGNISDAVIGFKFPYLVQEMVTEQRSPYYVSGDSIPAGAAVGDLISSNMNLASRIDNGNHPFYEEWKIKVPRGVKGDSITDIQIYPTKAKAGYEMYSNRTLTAPTGIYTDGTESVVLDDYNASHIYIKLSNGYYISINGGDKKKIRCKVYNYESKQSGTYSFEDIESYNVFVEDLRINSKNSSGKEGSGNQKLSYRFNSSNDYIDIGEPINYVVDSYVVPLESEEIALRGHLLVYYSDPARRTAATNTIKNIAFPSVVLGGSVVGWVDIGNVKGERGNINIIGSYDSFADIPNQSPEDIKGGDRNYAGWNALFKKSGTDTFFLAVYNYVTNQWEDVGAYTNDPGQFVTINSQSTILQENGFVFDVSKILNGEQVISKILQKKRFNYDVYQISPDLIQVSGLENSNIKNLEQMLLIGTDSTETIVKEIVAADDGGNPYDEPRLKTTRTVLYKTAAADNEYYKLIETKLEQMNMNYNNTTKTLKINSSPKIYNNSAVLYYHKNADVEKVRRTSVLNDNTISTIVTNT